jgi:8-amino-7-oxononanoate synthase
VGEVVLGLDLPRARRAIEVEEILHPGLIWLKDHALLGRPTVPMAVVLEWAAQLGGAQVEELTLYDGVVVEGEVRVRRRLDGEQLTVWAGDRVAWRGRARPVTVAPTGAIRSGGDAPKWDLSTFYANYTFHGPTLRGVLSVEGVGERHVTGTIRPGIPQEWGQSHWYFSPLAIDSALQLCQYWAQQRLGRSGFPVRVKEWKQLPMPEGTTELWVTAKFGEAVNDRFSGDVTITTADGVVVASGLGVEAELRTVDGGYEVPEEHWSIEKFPAVMDMGQRLEMAAALGIANPYFGVLEGTARDTVVVGGKTLIHFSGYNYLGFSGHPYVEDRVIDAVKRYGTSVSASRVASGERPIHGELEARISAAVGTEASLVFTAGHATNVTTIGHLFGPKDLILHDELIHDSVFQGMRLSGATRRPFAHADTVSLGRMLEQLRPRFEKVLIVVEGVYSMDGDLCDLPALIALKKRHKTLLMVDEAHSFGVVGERGYGVGEYYGTDPHDVDIWMGTLSKSLSSCGGYIAGSRALIEYLKYTAPGFIFSAGLTPANTMAAIASLELMEQEPGAVKKLQHNCRFFYERCKEIGLDPGLSRGLSAVAPVIVANSFHALLLSDAVKKRGVNVQPILYPAVADNASRLRFFLSSLHSEQQLERAARITHGELERIRKEHP